MELILKRNMLGQVVEGSDQLLLERASCGDDLTCYEESSTFACHIVLPNYVIAAGRVSGLSLPHLAAGDLTDPGRLERQPIPTIQYIYDSWQKTLICKDLLDEERTVSSILANYQMYKSFTWYSTRRYTDTKLSDLDDLKAFGDQFKVRLSLGKDFEIIIKPDIIYFPETGKDFLVKSSAMLLPTEFAVDPMQYAHKNRPLVASPTFSRAYLNIGSDRMLTIVHKQRFSVKESIEENLERSLSVTQPTPRFEGHQVRGQEPATMVTRLKCDYTILVPADEA